MVPVNRSVISVKSGIIKLAIVPSVSQVMEIQLMENVLVLRSVKSPLEMGMERKILNTVLSMVILMLKVAGLANGQMDARKCVKNVMRIIS